MKNYKINKEKCIGCKGCKVACEKAIEINPDGKAEITNPLLIEGCGGESLCPYGAIEEE